MELEFELMTKSHESNERPKALTLAEASLFVDKALREIGPEDEGDSCIDDRRPKNSPAGATPGGSAGYLAAGLGLVRRLRNKGLAIPNEAVRDAVFTIVGGKNKFNFHTDTHALKHKDSTPFEGCGHCTLLVKDPDSYFMDKEQTDFFRKTLEDVESAGVKPDVFTGDHAARAVMILRSINNPRGRVWALDSQAQLNSGMAQAFVYQEDLAEKRLTALAKTLAETSSKAKKHEAEIEDTLKRIADMQLKHTLGEFAPNLPHYTVTIDGETRKFSVEKTS